MPYSPLAGHDPSQRAQVLDSRNLVTSDYNAPNWMTAGDGGTGKWGDALNNVPLTPGTQYVLYDNRTNKVLGSGSTPEAFKSILDIINGTLVPQGNNANWRLVQMGGMTEPTDIHTRNPAPVGSAMQIDGQWGIPVAGDVPNHFLTDMLLPLLAPVAGAALGYFGGNALLGAGGGGAGSGGALGSVGSGVGGTGGAVGGGAVGGGAVGGGAVGGGALGAGVPATVGGGITVVGAPATGIGLGGVGAIGGAVGAGGLAAGAGGGASSAGSLPTTAGTSPITVTGTGTGGLGTGGALGGLGAGGAAAGVGGTATAGTDPITVTGKPPVTGVPNVPPIVVPPVTVPPVNVPQVPTSTTPQKSTIDKLIDYTRLAGLGIGTLGGLFGSSSGGSSGAAGFGQHSAYFNDSNLGPATIPGLAPGTGGARDMSGTDWAHYGEGPEQSFFNYVPQTPKHLAHGGALSQVTGPGDGREDKIPAMLSDGEYVVDAETVALLGNGSNKAGAQKLDQLRVKIRKQKGKALAKGSFSSDAKQPEHYLGGRV